MNPGLIRFAFFICAGFTLLSGHRTMAEVSHDDCDFSPSGRPGFVTTFRVDNDLFGGRDQDQGYSNGLQLSIVTPNLVDYINDPCLPERAQRLNRYLDWLYSGSFGEERNMIVSLQHAIYTPSSREATELVKTDRPFAGVLMLSSGYNAREGNQLRAGHLRFGVVGSAAMGEQIQNEWHRLVDVDRFRGWDNQLHNEPVVQLIHERMYRHTLMGAPQGNSGFGQDFISHMGWSLGNFATHINGGFEWRLGWRIPDDFGSAPLRPAGENAAPMHTGFIRKQLSGHFFVNTAARWVMHDITLDGNTFRTSHRVDKKPWVGDIGFGAVVYYGEWKFAFARYFRSREFHGQQERPIYGSFTISKQL